MAINAGKLDQRVGLLELIRTDAGWEWREVRRIHASVSLGTARQGTVRLETGKTLFSAFGIGANTAELVIRKMDLTLHHALDWKGQHLFLSEIRPDPESRGHLLVRAALVRVSACAFGEPEGGAAFPAVLTEKYLKHEQDMPMARNVLTYVLVTPKAVCLTPHDIVTVDGERYYVLVAHTLDPYKNEFEIRKEKEM